MQTKQRTNIPEGEWRSCRDVTLRDDALHCVLDSGRSYNLAEAYADNLHVRFANANSDKELEKFIRAWGPLRIPLDAILRDYKSVSLSLDLPMRYCRAVQGELRAVLDALAALKRGDGEREALESLLVALGAYGAEPPWEPERGIHELGPGVWGTAWVSLEDALRTARGASLAYVRDWLARVVEMSLPVRCKLGLYARGSKRGVEAGWELFSLESALRWMIWYDEFTKHPVVCCSECRKVFRGKTARVRKYCSEECGHRATARETMRRKRAAERAGRK